MTNKLGFTMIAAVGTVLALAGSAYADEAPAEGDAKPAEAPKAETPKAEGADAAFKTAPKADVDEDGVRFRGGISAGGGAEIVFGSGSSITAGMGGLDGRLGVQINDLIGIYAQPHLSFGSFGAGLGFGGFTGTAAGTAVVDFTFLDQIFVGAGGGYGVLNNPHGPILHIRAGGYPLMGLGEDNVRRKGLMLALDMRVFFVDGLTAVYPMGSIGYEAF